jgi:hypothetical protein
MQNLYEVIAKELGFGQGIITGANTKPTEEEVTLMAFAYLSNKGIIHDSNSLGGRGRIHKGLAMKGGKDDLMYGDCSDLMVGGRTPRQIMSPERSYVITMQHTLKKHMQEIQ